MSHDEKKRADRREFLGLMDAGLAAASVGSFEYRYHDDGWNA